VLRVLVRHSALKLRARRRSEILSIGEGIRDFGKTLIVGAGAGAQRLINEIRTDGFFNKCRPICAVDDDTSKIGFFIAGIPVSGRCEDIPELCKKHEIKTVFLAIPSLSASRRREVISYCIDSGVEICTVPSLSEIMMNRHEPMLVKKVRIEDLLGRDPVRIDLDKVMGYVEGKTVLVTGAGGSIGSELCRQLASHSPKKLILFDIYENGVYDILNEILRHRPQLDVEALIGSVRDYSRLEQIFKTRRPDIVYHAAAHQHVPLMEDSPNEAIKNNVFGTLNTVRAADAAGVKKFVMISTDKAVNPTNVMGATKRMCEMIIQAWNKKSNTEYVAVRFGNVLGSNGSVIPLFERQIAEGGPVTVTHPDIIRYFMTIPEAVSLVLQAGAEASGGEIFVLDMGEPVKIDDLARNMIRLSGLEPDCDIKIEYTGLRPGEKLYEELLMDEEGLQSTENKLIHIGRPIDFDEESFLSRLEELERVISDDSLPIRDIISQIVPTYINPKKANSPQRENN
jgi:FlaA1/EpsC-like NDP-sugar epimerase